ncbi:MT-A70 family methyltransferase [Ferrovibrio terrae]|uniref:MT-A70 family methyltransferase n=1 Tax=Ferrovibrio terrae TaxID=2594003 RepID=UPI00313834CD
MTPFEQACHDIAALPQGGYRVVYADPPWKFSAGKNKNPSRHYPTMPLRDIAALPVAGLAHPEGCRLLMWVTPPILLLPFGPREVLTAWGFKYSTVRTWFKLYNRENGLFIYNNSMSRGPGYEATGDAEFLVVAKRGRPERIAGGKPRGAIFGQRREHSRKPDFVRDEICTLFQGPRVELFTRTQHDGFDNFGNEIGKFEAAA